MVIIRKVGNALAIGISVIVAIASVGIGLQVFGSGSAKPSEWFKKDDPPAACEHVYEEGSHVCTICGEVSAHEYEEGSHVCTVCGEVSAHEYAEGSHVCTVCGETTEHTYEEGVCTICGEVQTYNLNFADLQSGFVVQIKVPHGEKPDTTLLQDPVREGYIFKGWYSGSAEKKTLFDPSAAVTSHMFYIAKWEEARCTIRFDTAGGSNVVNRTVGYGGKLDTSLIRSPIKSNYDFAGWYYDKECTEAFDRDEAIVSDITLYAKWTLKEYTVTFLAQGGSETASQKVLYSEHCAKPQDPEREDYTFTGWSTSTTGEPLFDFEGTAVTGDITLYAAWARIEYTVTYRYENRNKETATETPVLEQKQTVFSGNALTALYPAPTAPDADFGGWYTDEAFTNVYNFSTHTPVRSDFTLYGKWNVITFTVTFDSNYTDGPIESVTVVKTNPVEAPESPVREEYDFDGWYTEASCTNAYDFESAVTQSFTLYAKWTVKSFKVYFDCEGERTNLATKTVTYGNTVTYPRSPVSQNGLSFLGWYTREESTAVLEEGQYARTVDGVRYVYTAFDRTQGITEDTTLYAHWEGLQDEETSAAETAPDETTG